MVSRVEVTEQQASAAPDGQVASSGVQKEASLGASREEEATQREEDLRAVNTQKANPRSLHLTRKHSSLVEGKPGPTKVRNKQKKQKEAGGINIEKD